MKANRTHRSADAHVRETSSLTRSEGSIAFRPCRSPSPQPSPAGRGSQWVRARRYAVRLTDSDVSTTGQIRTASLPLPAGEGWGEGENLHLPSGFNFYTPLSSFRLRTWASALLALLAALVPATAATPALVHSAVVAGGRQTVGSVVVNSSIGGIGGSASVATLVARHGFAGQLTDVQSVAVTASPTTVNEGSTRQLAATATFTDGTVLPLAAASATWSVSSGQLASVSSAGLATAATVYQDTNGVARADYLGQSGTLTLSVLNVNNDDYGTYAGDGLDDAWQVQYFGIGSANAGPTADPDGDGQNNVFEYLAGTSPVSASSLFTLSIGSATASQRTLSFNPITAGRTYSVEYRTNVASGGFTTLTGAAQSDNGSTRAVTDPGTGDAVRYYRVRISLP